MEKRILIHRTPLDYFFVAYFAVGTISFIFSVGEGMLIIFVKRLLLIPIVYLIGSNVTTKKHLQYLICGLISIMVILSVIGIHKYLSGVGGLEGRLKLFHHYMTSGGILMIVGLMTFSFVFSRAPVKIRLITLACGILMIFPLIFTFTRSSWMGFLCGLCLITLLHDKRWILGILVVASLFLFLAPRSFKERAFSIFDPYHPNNIDRTYMWKAGVEIIKDRPITGVGDVGLGNIYEQYRAPEAKPRQGHLHNNFIMFAVTLGIPGLIVMLALFIQIFLVELKIYRSIPTTEWLLKSTVRGCLAIFVGFQVNGLFEWNFGDAEIAMLLWLSVGLVLSVEKIIETEPRKIHG